MKIIRVAAAVITHDGKIFATQRGYGEFAGGWEFPGGKVEPGEAPQAALAREIMEELDTQIEDGAWLDTVEYDYPEFHLSMDCFWCTIRSGHLVLKEHEAARWLTHETLDSVDWLPADRQLVRKIRMMDRIVEVRSTENRWKAHLSGSSSDAYVKEIIKQEDANGSEERTCDDTHRY